MSTVSKPRYFLKSIFIIVLAATFAAWLKMLFPRLSIGYWPLWANDSLRNKIGMLISMPLFELFYLGYLYVLFLIVYALVSSKWSLIKHSHIMSSLFGILISVFIYALYKLSYYLNYAHLYNIHHGEFASRPWHTWVEYPQDLQLLGIYAASGFLGGWLYYRLITRYRLSIS